MNINRKIVQLLVRMGLTETEARFYLAVYQNPKLTMADLRKICGFSLATCYRVFESLYEKKFLTSSADDWKKNIEAVSLKTLASKLGRESLRLRKVEYELKKLGDLMEFSSVYSVTEPTEILTDQNQISDHCYRLLNADWDHIQCYGSGEKAYEVPGYKPMRDFVTLRAKRGKTIDAVFTELGQHTRELLKNNGRELRNGKLLIDPYCQNSMTHMYDKQVTIWQKDPELGNRVILIHDPGLIRLYQANFQKTWKALHA